jgi:hypothetical protein
MQPIFSDLPAIKAVKQKILKATQDHFKVKDSYLNEAIARAYGENTFAALSARLKQNPGGTPEAFDRTAFVARLMELDQQSAEAVGVLLEGAQIRIDIEKRGPALQRRYLDVAYDVTVEVSGVAAEVLEASPRFLLPDFRMPDQREPYRLDSAHYHRVEHDFPVTRNHEGRQLMTAELINGRWVGGLFVYAPDHQVDDSSCLRAARAALVRAILPAVTSRLRCWIFRPDGYDYGAWRIQMFLGPAIREFWGGSRLAFSLPELAHRRVHATGEYLFDSGVGLFQDGEWQAHLYTNGIAEEKNPTSIGAVRAALISTVSETLRKAGFQG